MTGSDKKQSHTKKSHKNNFLNSYLNSVNILIKKMINGYIWREVNTSTLLFALTWTAFEVRPS